MGQWKLVNKAQYQDYKKKKKPSPEPNKLPWNEIKVDGKWYLLYMVTWYEITAAW